MSAEADAHRAWEIMRALIADDDRRAEVTDAVDLSFWRAKALRRIAAHSPTLSELAAMVQTDSPYITLVVRDLEERGLVVRTANPADGRSKVVRVTDAGARCAALAESILNRPSGGVSNLPAEDIAVLVSILERALAQNRAPQRQ